MNNLLQNELINFKEKLVSYLVEDEVIEVFKAYKYAERAHEGQQRQSGEPYISHPLAVAQILVDLRIDYQCLMAALLHDVVEDTFVTYDNLVQEFGVRVADLVFGVTKLTHIDFQTKAQAQAENFQKMAMAMVKDIRVILIKLADRLHNMRTLGSVPSVKAKRVAQETLDIYAPIAKRLGLYDIYLEFEDLGFNVIHPMRANLIKSSMQKVRKKHKNVIDKVKQRLSSHLRDFGLFGEVIGSEKHLYSIYRKMNQDNMSFVDIMNIYTLKVVVDSQDNCYRTLGKVHELYKPKPGYIRDYIAIPKVNGYQSLHTTIFVAHDVSIEVQIRTYKMNEFANKGITVLNSKLLQSNDFRIQNWINLIADLQVTSDNSADFLASFKNDLFSDAVYVFTPRGKIIELPRNSCAIDFAYMVHSDIGDSCVACRINRELAPLWLRLLRLLMEGLKESGKILLQLRVLKVELSILLISKRRLNLLLRVRFCSIRNLLNLVLILKS